MMNVARALVLAAVLLPAAASAQEGIPPSLSLQQAVEIARARNPGFRATQNDAELADWEVRNAYSQFLPQATAGVGVQWQGAGEQQFGSLTLGDLGFTDQPSYYLSNYRLGLTWSLSWASLKGPAQSKSDRRVTESQIGAAEANLTTQVTNAYLEVLRRQEALRIAELQLENSEFNLRLAEAQLAVGAVTRIDVGQAEVQVGRSRVLVLQAQNGLETGRLRLMQQLGQPISQVRDQPLELSTQFGLTEPTWDVESLEAQARQSNPSLRTRRASRESADIGVSVARRPTCPRSRSRPRGAGSRARRAAPTSRSHRPSSRSPARSLSASPRTTCTLGSPILCLRSTARASRSPTRSGSASSTRTTSSRSVSSSRRSPSRSS